MSDPTALQVETLRFIAAYIDQHGYPPSFKDIAKKWDIQVSAVFARLGQLERKGLVTRVKKLARSTRLTPLGMELAQSGTPIIRTSTTQTGHRPIAMASRSEGENT